MQIKLNFNKSIEENASDYFEAAKKARKKYEGAKKALEISRKKAHDVDERRKKQEEKAAPEVKREWFEKFRWFFSSDGFLVIGGRDATTNDIIVKKHMEKDDLVFHTEMPGSPFAVIKSGGKDIPEQTIKEAAEFCASFSRAWKQGMASMDVYAVKPEQVSLQAPAGQFMGKGSFMVYGERRYITAVLRIAVGIHDSKVMAGPVSAVKKNCREFIELMQGDEKPSDIAKLVKKKLGCEIDDVIKVLPAGSFRVRK